MRNGGRIGEPVALICTGATASRNYIPGLTEAYYRKLPVLAITTTIYMGNIGHNIPQVIDRREQLNDIVNKSVQIPSIYDIDSRWYATVEINKALNALFLNGGGPAHINLEIGNAPHFSVKNISKARKITTIEPWQNYDELPELKGKIGIFVGNHKKWSRRETAAIDEFIEKYDAVVLCDSTSNYSGKYGIRGNIILDQEKYKFSGNNFDILIHIGEVSGSYMKIDAKDVWRVSPDNRIVDTFRKVSHVFAMPEIMFFEGYNQKQKTPRGTNAYSVWEKEYSSIAKKANEVNVPLSNIWLAQQTANRIPANTVLHLGILSSLRSWNYFLNNKDILCFSNTGGFGIDGCMSSALGSALISTDTMHYLVIGDLAFFYDLNSLGNRMIRNNIRILLVNNGCGGEFHLHINPAFQRLGHDGVSRYIAADGHFGNKSKDIVKGFVESLGFEYIQITSKKEYSEALDYFVDENMHKKPLVMEVFTDAEDENEALRTIRCLKTSISGTIKNKVGEKASKILSGKTKKVIKEILK